jgi:ATP-binding cassette subfamily C protein CydC
MKPVLKIVSLWGWQSVWLGFGALLSLGALAAGAVLMHRSGQYTGLALLGGGLMVPAALQSVGVARVILRYLERVFTHDATFRALARLRIWFFDGLAKSAAGGLGHRRAGDVLARMVNDVDALDGLYLRITVPLLGALLLLPILGVVLWRETPWALLVFIPFAGIGFYLPWVASRLAEQNAGRVGLAMSGLRSAALDALTGLREVKIFAAEGRMLAQVQSREAALLAAQRELVGQTSVLNGIAFVAAQAAILLTILIGFAAHAPVAVLAAMLVVVLAFETVLGLPRAGLLFGQAEAAAKRVVEAAETPPPVPEPRFPAALPPSTLISFETVTYRYPTSLTPVFENLSFTLTPGSRTAILGPSGAGKSTIASLILRLASPESGKIRFGGLDVAALPNEAVRQRVAYLSQATHLFADTIRNNLTLGDTRIDDAALWGVLDAAQLTEVVQALPEGLGAWVGEGGQTLSGGQGRRLALARVLLSPAPILILDEPCAGLDAATEAEFMRTLNIAAEGRTVLLLLHRLSGAEQLDRIWRLTGGSLMAATG